ncbi:MAG: hypothetical protein O3C49_10775 [Proteobacteria bacterium]|nr:hypothetical protein [Pseudomonadota bacterium]
MTSSPCDRPVNRRIGGRDLLLGQGRQSESIVFISHHISPSVSLRSPAVSDQSVDRGVGCVWIEVLGQAEQRIGEPAGHVSI